LQRREKDLFELGDLLGGDRKFILKGTLEKPIVWEVFAPLVRVDLGNFRRGKNGLTERFYIVTSFLRTDRLARSIGDSNPTGGRLHPQVVQSWTPRLAPREFCDRSGQETQNQSENRSQ
jgi:hypothetical protein